jgi:hypothetical protein
LGCCTFTQLSWGTQAVCFGISGNWSSSCQCDRSCTTLRFKQHWLCVGHQELRGFDRVVPWWSDLCISLWYFQYVLFPSTPVDASTNIITYGIWHKHCQ